MNKVFRVTFGMTSEDGKSYTQVVDSVTVVADDYRTAIEKAVSHIADAEKRAVEGLELVTTIDVL